MAENSRKHQIPAGTETSVSRETIFETFGESIHDVVPVANTTERDLVVAALSPSSTDPLVVHRADAPGLHRQEYSEDGTVWVPTSGFLRFASTGDRDTWTTANSALLSAGDVCFVAGVSYRWSGTAWNVAAWQAVSVSSRKGGTQSLTASTMTNVLTVALPSTAPPGVYQMIAVASTWSGSATTHFKQVRRGGTSSTGSGTAFSGTSDSVAAAASVDVERTFVDTFTHTGGALDFWLDVQTNAAGNANAGCRLQVVFLGFS